MASPSHRGNRFVLSTGKNLCLLSHALCHWQCMMTDHDWEDDGPLEPGESPGLKPTRNYSVYAQFGLSATNLDGRRRLRVSLWASMSAETDGGEVSLGAAVDTDHEVELERGTPTFLKFRRVEFPSAEGDDDGARESFPGGLLIATMISDTETHLHWALSFPVLAVVWDSLFERAAAIAAGLPNVPSPPPVRPQQRTLQQMLGDARAKRKRGQKEASE